MTSVITLVALLGSGLTLLKALVKGIPEGRRQFLGVLGMCRRRPLTHTQGFLVLSFGRVRNVGVGKSFVMKVWFQWHAP